MTKIRFPVLLVLCLVWAVSAVAQDQGQDKKPIEVTADSALEWDRTKSVFIARGNAVATQGLTSIRADTLTASYTESNEGITIETIRAQGDTVIRTEDMTGYGDGGLYHVTKGYAVLTGDAPRIEAGQDTLTARNRITYDMNDNKMEATGGVVVTRPKEKLKADRATAFFTKAADGTMMLDTVKAAGNVVIATETETLYGDRADYNAADRIAVVTGNVRIEKDRNVLTGEKAEFNLNTRISTLTSPTDSGRVKGVFYPKSDEGQ